MCALKRCIDSPGEIPGRLTGNSSYGYDHQAESDAEIERQVKEYDELRSIVENSPRRQRLRAMGKLSSRILCQ